MLIEAGRVIVAGRPIRKASQKVNPDVKIELLDALDYVSRAGHKLAKALDIFSALEVEGKTALDVGASTGGFTDVLLRKGASKVIAVDVGHDQMVSELKANSRVFCLEGFNAREMTSEALSEAIGIENYSEPMIVVADLSFISLTLVLPAINRVAPNADLVLLVKPQFEAGKKSLNAHGIVTDHRVRAEAIRSVVEMAETLGFRLVDMVRSALPGTHGNVEYVLWMNKKDGKYLSQWIEQISEIAKEGK